MILQNIGHSLSDWKVLPGIQRQASQDETGFQEDFGYYHDRLPDVQCARKFSQVRIRIPITSK